MFNKKWYVCIFLLLYTNPDDGSFFLNNCNIESIILFFVLTYTTKKALPILFKNNNFIYNTEKKNRLENEYKKNVIFLEKYQSTNKKLFSFIEKLKKKNSFGIQYE